MEAILYGALGAFLALLFLSVGIIIGKAQKQPYTPAEEPTEAEQRKMRQAQEAFDMLQNYTPEQAYGMYRPNALGSIPEGGE